MPDDPREDLNEDLERRADEVNAMFERVYPEGRDPYRIGRLTAKLIEVWTRYPEWRLGQLLVNLLPPRLGNDAFYFEDEELERALDFIIQKGFAVYRQQLPR